MKTFNKILTVVAATAMLAAGCVNEDPAYKKNDPGTTPPDPDAKGYLALSDMSMRIVVETETQPDDTSGETQKPQSRAAEAQPDVDGFIVTFTNAAGEVVLEKSYGELKGLAEGTGTVELPVGSYTLEVRSEKADATPAAAWEHPAYYASRSVAIEKNKTTEIDEVVCTLDNIKVTLMCSKDLADRLTDATVSTLTLGETAMTFAKGETRAAYFMPLAETNTLDFRLEGAFADQPEVPVRFSKSIPNVKAGQWRKISLVITFSDKGDIKLDIDVNDFIGDDEIVVEDPENPEEPVFPVAPALEWAEHDLTQPFQLRAEMFDTQGNYAEPFTLNLSAPNGIASLVLKITSDNPGFVAALTGMLGGTEVDLCSIEASNPAYTALAGLGFPVGDALKGATAKSFDIAPAMKLLYPAYPGTHTFSFVMNDAQNMPGSAALTLIADPEGEAVPTIVWRGQDIDQQYTLGSDTKLDVVVDITTQNSIQSLEVTIDSDELTETELTMIGLPPHFDLCNVEGFANKTAEQVAASLKSLGFPVNDAIKGEPTASFDITTFVPLLKGFKGKNNFVLKVTDEKGNTTTKTLQFYVE